MVGIIVILKGNAVATGVKNGLALTTSVIIPSLFLFSVISIFALKSGFIFYFGEKITGITNKLFGLSGTEFSIFFISLFGGYFIGAKLINELYSDEKISRSRAEKLLYCSINPAPSFVIYTVGSLLLNNIYFGIIFFISNIITTFLFLLFQFSKDKNTFMPVNVSYENSSLTDAFVLSVESTCKIFLNVCGWIVLFSGICEIILSFKGVYILKFLSELLLEISIAVVKAPKLSVPIFFYSFLLSFGGMSAICQIISAAKNLKISLLKLLAAKSLHGIMSSSITFFIIKLFPSVAETFSNGVTTIFTGFNLNISSLFLLVLAVIFIIYIKQ